MKSMSRTLYSVVVHLVYVFHYNVLPTQILKRGYSHFVFYYKELIHDYQRLLQALKALR